MPEESETALKEFLQSASRPVMGKAKKMRTAGQTPIELEKHLSTEVLAATAP